MSTSKQQTQQTKERIMFITETSAAVFHAIRAARLERTIGSRMARLYARRHGCMSLYILARFLERSAV